jgi:Zn-finger protein
MTDAHDKLVLFIEEKYDGIVDMSCYVLYDASDREYFVCGIRSDNVEFKYAPFHFFCKSTRTILSYLKFITNANDSRLTYGLFNFNNIFENVEYINYERLEAKRSDLNEIAVYVDMEFNKKQMMELLIILKEVRY